ncbi:MAG: type II toxin-antitoxin system VapC family toxin [Gammaproteobacteria bacterium]|nr:type II toxin-antitoxin system VapC family toxin [Gammaproteobacteria bacterium]
MKPTVYIETSVVSYLASRPSSDVIIAGWQAISHDWWDNHRQRFDLRISVLVEEEISRGDESAAKRRLALVTGIPSLSISEEAVNLAELLLSQGTVPKGSEEDALHIGIAAAQGADYLLTWNFKHINNAETKSVIIKTVESCGFVCPQLCSPEELGGTSND